MLVVLVLVPIVRFGCLPASAQLQIADFVPAKSFAVAQRAAAYCTCSDQRQTSVLMQRKMGLAAAVAATGDSQLDSQEIRGIEGNLVSELQTA